MIRHIFTTGLKKGTSEEQLQEIILALRKLDGKIDGMINFQVGKNLSWHDNKAQLVLCAEFDNKKDWEIYMKFPQHIKVGDKYGHLFDTDTSTVVQIEF